MRAKSVIKLNTNNLCSHLSVRTKLDKIICI